MFQSFSPPKTYSPMDGWGKLISFVGVPSGIALYLVFNFTTSIASDVKTTRDDVKVLLAVNADSIKMNNELRNLLTKICVNTAKSAPAIDNCFNK